MYGSFFDKRFYANIADDYESWKILFNFVVAEHN